MIKSIRRHLNLHEYQAADLLHKYKLPILKGYATQDDQKAYKYAQEIVEHNPLGFVLKAQVHSGGRGRGYFKNSQLQGGVHILQDPKEAQKLSQQMLNDILITKQTGKKGKPCKYVYVVERIDLKQELYLSIMLDRQNACPIIIASSQGGMGIEEIESEKIIKYQVDPKKGLQKEDISKIVDFMKFNNKDLNKQFQGVLKNLYKLFKENDSTLIEINPLGITKDDKIVVCDTKLNIDDNAIIRRKKLFEMEDLSQTDPLEVTAKKYDLNYVKMDGSIGCMVNGAGLAMATMDLIKFRGGSPANFLDIGGGSNRENIKQAVKIIDQDSDVKVILINIFGGIVRCDLVVQGLIDAVKELDIKKPIYIRMQGNKASLAQQLIQDSGLDINWQNSPEEAIKAAIERAKTL